MKEILLVEASPALLASRVKTLKRQDYQVTGATTAGEIAKAMKQGPYDLLIVDAGVPEAPAPEVKPPINWPVLGGVIAAVVVGLLIFLIVRRRAY